MRCVVRSSGASDLSKTDGPIFAPGLVRADHVWVRTLGVRSHNHRPALFLDRDGVIIVERHYLSRPDDVALIDGAAATIAAARAHGVAVVIVTNQSGIGRGKFGWPDYRACEDRMLAILAHGGATVDMILACPHHPSGARPPYDVDHPWRKPSPGMLLAARDQLNLDLAMSNLVGDKASDIEAARAAGLPRAVHVATGHGRDERAAALALSRPGFDVIAVPSIADFVV